MCLWLARFIWLQLSLFFVAASSKSVFAAVGSHDFDSVVTGMIYNEQILGTWLSVFSQLELSEAARTCANGISIIKYASRISAFFCHL